MSVIHLLTVTNPVGKPRNQAVELAYPHLEKTDEGWLKMRD